MQGPFSIAALWIALALLSTVLAARLKISTALMEILVGMAAGWAATLGEGPLDLGTGLPWLTFIASLGAVALTFLAGAELDPDTIRQKWREVSLVGAVGFIAPFLGCAALARHVLGWSPAESWLAGVALSTTSMAVVYAVMLEFGFNKTEFGKGILGSCFVNDLGTVIALGLIFAPFTSRTVIFVVVSLVAFVLLPHITPLLFRRYSGMSREFRTKWVLLVLFGLGALASWAGSEAVLPAYLVGMVLAKIVGRDDAYLKRFRTLTLGLLTPFYFIRAGSLVRVPALLRVPTIFAVLFSGKVLSKIVGLFPVVSLFRTERKERVYYTLLMSTGLTFGTISALYGLTHGIVSEAQYSHLVAVVIGSAVIPTLIANAAFLPRHLLPPSISQRSE
jgi:glutathione-regulated potassium-efflux system ancillary protein KefC